RSGTQRLHVAGDAGEVCVSEPETLARCAGDHLIEPHQARTPGLARHYPKGHAAGRRDLGPSRPVLSRYGITSRLPHSPERPLHVGYRRTAELHAPLAPCREALPCVADPCAPHTETCNEADAAVHAQHLAMIAVEPAEWLGEAGRVEAANLHAALAQTSPEGAAGFAECAHPVVQHAHVHSFLRLPQQRIREFRSSLIVVDDVALEVDPPLRGGYGFEPRRIVLGCISKQAHVIAM